MRKVCTCKQLLTGIKRYKVTESAECPECKRIWIRTTYGWISKDALKLQWIEAQK